MSRLGKILYLFAALSLASFTIVRILIGGWVPFLWLALGMFGACVVGSFYLDRKFYSEFLGMKTTKQGMSMGAMIGLVLILVIAVNVIGARKSITWDLSLNKVNTLSEQSIQMIKGLKSELKVLYFYKEGTEGVEQNRRAFMDLIRKYQDNSDQVKLQFVEVNERPDLTAKYNITKGTQAVLLDYQGRTNLVEKIDEQEITSALVKVTREKEKKIFILAGHGELPLEASQDGQSLSILKQLLEGNNYRVQPLSLTSAPAIPADADAVLIVGPRMGFIDVEVKALEDYLKRGGSLILALKPKMSHGLDAFLKKLGVQTSNNYIATVLETPVGRAIDPRFTRGSEFSKDSQITRPFGRSEYTVFRLPQSLSHSKVSEAIEVQELVKTNDSAMAFPNLEFQSDGQKGPFTLALEIRGTYPGAAAGTNPFSLLVFGDSDFLNDQYLYQNLNRDLLLNSIAALVKEDNLISISPKEVATTKMEMGDTQFLLYIFAFIIPLPLAFFGLSGFFWFRRRYA